jgi:GntR family transcriptional regulator
MNTSEPDRSAAPLYQQMAGVLEDAIVRGEYAADTYLPGEKDLARRFNVSLITVRAAMSVLIDKGLIERRRGKGTIVRDRSMNGVWELGWLGNLVTSVLGSKLEIVIDQNITGPHWATSRLNTCAGEPIHFMRTVRRAVQRNDEAFMTTDLYHRKEIGEALEQVDFANQNIQQKLIIMTVERVCKLAITNVRQTMSAETADHEAGEILGVKAGSPLLVVTRDYFSHDGTVIQTGRSRYRTDNYEYVLNVARSEGRRNTKAIHGSIPRMISG